MPKTREELLRAEVERRQRATDDDSIRLAEYERQLISGQARSPVAQRIIDLSSCYGQLALSGEKLPERDAAILVAELSITEGVEVVPDTSTLELSSEKKPEE